MAAKGDLDRALRNALRDRAKADDDNKALIAKMQKMDADIAILQAAIDQTDPALDQIIQTYSK